MALFSSTKPKPTSQAIHTLLGKDTQWKGEIHCGVHSLRIEGKVEGTIYSQGEVTIAPTGSVEGIIQAKHLIVTGKVKGKVTIAECLEIHGTGFVEGEAEVGSLVVDEGGILQGTCTRREKNPPARAIQREEAKPASSETPKATGPATEPKTNGAKPEPAKR